MKPIWTILISIVITGLIVGGGVYYFQNKNAKSEQDNLKNQIATLQKQVSDLKSQTTATTTPTATTTTSVKVTEKTYKNDTYKFAFDMYRPIREYKVTESKSDSDFSSWKDAVLFITFYEPTNVKAFQDKDGYYPTDKVMVIPTSKWTGDEYYNDTDKTDDKWVAKKLGTSGSYTIALLDMYGRDYPEDLSSTLHPEKISGNFQNFQSF